MKTGSLHVTRDEEEAVVLRNYLTEVKAAIARGDTVRVDVDPLIGWSVLSALHLSLRHPGFAGANRSNVERFVDALEERLIVGPATREVARRGRQGTASKA